MLEKAYYWPTWLAKSLDPQSSNRSYKFNHAQLALWRALNIYDDLIDGDNPQADLMSANHEFRKFLKTIYSAGLPPAFINLTDKAINSWEIINNQEKLSPRLIIKNGCPQLPSKLPKLKPENGYQKSIPLAIAPLALAVTTKMLKSDKEINTAFIFFKMALSAKQLADDASDWLSDLKNGFINPVNLLVLEAAKKRGVKLNLKTKPEIIYLLFAEAAGLQTAKTIINLCRQAKTAAAKLKIEENSPLIRELITPLTKAAEKALNFKKML